MRHIFDGPVNRGAVGPWRQLPVHGQSPHPQSPINRQFDARDDGLPILHRRQKIAPIERPWGTPHRGRAVTPADHHGQSFLSMQLW